MKIGYEKLNVNVSVEEDADHSKFTMNGFVDPGPDHPHGPRGLPDTVFHAHAENS